MVPYILRLVKNFIWRYFLSVLLSLGIMISQFASVLPEYNVKLPFDFVTISLTLAGLLIVGGVWGRSENNLFHIGKIYIKSGILFVVFSISAPVIRHLLPPSVVVVGNAIEAIGLLAFIASLILAPVLFATATHKLLENLDKRPESGNIQKAFWTILLGTIILISLLKFII